MEGLRDFSIFIPGAVAISDQLFIVLPKGQVGFDLIATQRDQTGM